MAKTLSKEARDNIMSAIELTADFINDGEDPNQAIAKAANDRGIPPSAVGLLVSAYNTGRANKQRQEGATLLEKAADVPLADTSKVLEILYPTNVKSAEVIHQETAVSDDYSMSPRSLVERREREWLARNGPSFEKAAENELPPAPRDLTRKAAMAWAKARRLQRDIEESRRKEAAAVDFAAEQYSRLHEYFREPDAVSPSCLRKQATVLFGPSAGVAMDHLQEAAPWLMKRAAARRDVVLSALSRPMQMMARLLTAAENCAEKHAEHVKTAEEKHREIRETLAPYTPDVPRSILGEPMYPELEEKRGALTGVLAPVALASSAMSNISKTLKPDDESSATKGMLQDIADPVHEDQLRRIRSQTMLHELLSNDPVISQYPDEAIEAFNDIVATSPRAADQKMLMRSLLRQRLEQSGDDPFQVDQLLGMEDKLRKRDSATQTTPKPSESVLDG